MSVFAMSFLSLVRISSLFDLASIEKICTCVLFAVSYSVLMKHASTFVRNLIGQEAKCVFRTQKELADRSGLQPSTINGLLRANQIEPATLKKILDCLPQRLRKQALAAAVRDAIPEGYARMVFEKSDVSISEADASGLLSELAQKMLAWLKAEAIRDPKAQASLETQARWIGLDK